LYMQNQTSKEEYKTAVPLVLPHAMECQVKKSTCQQAIMLLGALVVVLLVSRVVSLSQRVQELESRPDYDEDEIIKLVRAQIDETVKSMEARARQHAAQRQQQLAQAHQAQEQQRLAAEAAAAEAAHQAAVTALAQQQQTAANAAAAAITSAHETKATVDAVETNGANEAHDTVRSNDANQANEAPEPADEPADDAEQPQPEVTLTPRAPRKKTGTKKRVKSEAVTVQVPTPEVPLS
jgi:hypothetical protein